MKAYLRKDGRYECRIQRTIDGKKHKFSFYGATAEIAVEKCRIFKENILDKPFAKFKPGTTEVMTIPALIEEWFEQKRLVHKESTQANYRTKASKHIMPAFDGICIYDLTHQKVNEFACKLIDKGLSINYVRSIMVLFKSILAYGVRAYGMNISLDLISLPSKEFREREIYSHEEVSKLFKYSWSVRTTAAIAVILAIGFGLRIGEICGTKWSDIDFDNKILHIRRTVQRISSHDRDKKTKVICTTPKSRSSVRALVIPDRLCEVLRSLKRDGNIYIVSGKDTYIEPRVLQNRYKALVKECGLRYLSFHSLRHSKATSCFENGIDDVTIAKILGHSSPEITRQIYIHSGIEQQRKQAPLMDIPVGYIA